MNLQQLFVLIKNLIVQPVVELKRLSSENIHPKQTLNHIIVPLLTAIVVSNYFGRVVFGHEAFGDSLNVLLTKIFVIIFTQALSLLIFSVILNEVLPYFEEKRNFGQSFTLITYSFIPALAANVIAGILPKLSPLFNIFGLYSFYLYWYAIQFFYPKLTFEKRQIFVPLTLVLMMLVYLAIFGICGLIFSR
jgi:hypothetical protein